MRKVNKRRRSSSPVVAKSILQVLRYDMIIAVGVALLLFAAGIGIGKYSHQQPIVVKQMSLNCSNLTMPEIGRIEKMVSKLANKTTKVECVTEMPFKYIQPAHNTIRYSQNMGSLIVQADSLISDGKGSSMIPVFFEGNTLIAVKYNGQTLKPGMIISYRDGGESPIHRISSVYEDGIVVKGDANNVEDGTISKGQVESIIIGVLYT